MLCMGATSLALGGCIGCTLASFSFPLSLYLETQNNIERRCLTLQHKIALFGCRLSPKPFSDNVRLRPHEVIQGPYYLHDSNT